MGLSLVCSSVHGVSSRLTRRPQWRITYQREDLGPCFNPWPASLMCRLGWTILSCGESFRQRRTLTPRRRVGQWARRTSASPARELSPGHIRGAKTSWNNSSVLSEFFRSGQVIETFRGKGIWQPAIDLAIEKVNDGGWVCGPPFGLNYSGS